MNSLRRILLPLLLVLLASPVRAATDIEFVLDLSGSMRQQLGGVTQIDAARQALERSLDEIPKGQMVAVRVYGHRVEQSDKAASCKDTELVVPFHELDKQVVLSRLKGLTPKGYTPIAHSLLETRNDLYDVGMARESERVIILLTDGEETCDGDPIAVLDQLEREGFKLKVFAIGFNVNDVARAQLKGIADHSGGKYFDAKDAAQLNQALQEATKESVLVAKAPSKSYGTSIRGGDSYEDAVALEYDKEYRLDHHQQKAKYDYFYIDIDSAAEVTATINVTDIGLAGLAQGNAQENAHPYGGLEIHGRERNQLKKVEIIGDQFATKALQMRVPESGRYYVLVGSQYGDTHKDYFTFKLTREAKGDADTERDAGEALEAALPVEAKRYAANFIGDADKLDVFSFEAKAGESYFAGVVPGTKGESYFQVRILDEFRQALYEGTSKSGEGLRSDKVTMPDDGTYYLEIGYAGGDSIPYALVLKKVEAPAGESAGGEPAE
ncbi:MAG: VWA domain-containing protein [Bdellovibrionales bacterium]|nr:VWA domain-containing protein [Bdellovibrionales bacterium]